jgi:hypothetical protein
VPLGSTTFWAAILPVEKTNLVLRPSAERDAIGVASINSATIGTSSQYQQFGAWSYAITPDANTNSGASFGTYSSGNGTSYTLSAYVRAAAGVPMRLYVAASNSLDSGLGSVEFTGGGTWQRYSVSYTENSSTNRRAGVVKRSSADTNIYYVDGLQAEVGSLTTYLDGEQEGCYWQGVPHASPSTRSGTYRGGGSVIALADLGLKPDEHLGIGMPPQEITALSYALLPGAEYQRSRAGERAFTLTFEPILGTTTQDYHITRRRIINAIKPDLVDPQQPVRFWYTGGQGTVQIDAVYQSGLELGEMDGPMAENGAVTFVAHDPYWYATTQEGTALSARTSLGSANRLVYRDPVGRWGTVGVAGTTTNNAISALAFSNGTLFAGGLFTTAGGTTSGALVSLSHTTKQWGTLGGTVSSGVLAVAVDPLGTVRFGGAFTGVSGLTNTRFNAQWSSGGFGTWAAGTVNNTLRAIGQSGGTTFFGGDMTAANGSATRFAGQWTSAGYGTLTNGSVDNVVNALTVGLDRRLYMTGLMTTAGGTTANFVAQWSGSFGTMGLGFTGGGAGGGGAIAVGPSGIIYGGGGFGSAGGGTAQNVGQWPGAQWFRMSDGLGALTPGDVLVTALTVDMDTGNVYAGGQFSAVTGARALADYGAVWNGYIWQSLDIDLPSNNPSINAFALAPDRTLYVAGPFTGTAHAASITTVVNTGLGESFPTVKMRNNSAAPIRLYQLGNTLTGDMLYFDMTFEPGEELTLVTKPGARSFTSDYAGNVFGRILPGSNITGFRLMPGTNTISLFCDSGSVATSIYWAGRSDTVDGGTIY